MAITARENEKFAALLADLDDDDWSKPTDCDRWDVRALAAHVVGSAAGQASPREFVRQVRTGRPVRIEIGAPNWWDGMNEVQVRERVGLSTTELRAEWDEIAPRALRARTRLPKPIAALPVLKLPPPVGRQRVRYLFDMGFTRDVWMHRVDLAAAVDKPFDADAEHDGRIVEDIVAEWAATHGQPFVLELSGPAGGTFEEGTGGERVEMDAIEFCRVIAERGEGAGLLEHKLPL